MEHLGHDVHHQIKHVAAGHTPVQLLVLVQRVQREIPGMTSKFFMSIFSLIFCFYQGAGRIIVTRSHAAIPISTVLVADFIQGLKGIAGFDISECWG